MLSKIDLVNRASRINKRLGYLENPEVNETQDKEEGLSEDYQKGKGESDSSR
jgi:hypothetical protein